MEGKVSLARSTNFSVTECNNSLINSAHGSVYQNSNNFDTQEKKRQRRVRNDDNYGGKMNSECNGMITIEIENNLTNNGDDTNDNIDHLKKQQEKPHQQQGQQHHVDNDDEDNISFNNNLSNNFLEKSIQQSTASTASPPSSPGKIQKIDAKSVQRIVAGQAVTDLASAVKELVDNALDACSQSINVRLFNRGISIVEVSDDGTGVPIDSRKYLATPHATSKIRSFEDIYHCPDDSSIDDDDDGDSNNSVSDSANENTVAQKQDQTIDLEEDDDIPSSAMATMGFRGEALFCLANLSGNLMVSTRTADEEMAEQMEFRKDGSLNTTVGVSKVPRKIGTSVAIVSLFESIPVRRKDMIRRIKAQRSKLLDVMEGYAIFSTDAQIHLMDMIEQNNDYTTKTLLQTSKNNYTISETVSSILGPKFLQSTSPISINLTDIVSNSKDAVTSSSTSSIANVETKRKAKYKLHGIISNAANVSSRTSSINMKGVRHAQFFAINRRPVDLPKIVRLINETWRSLVGSFGNGINTSSTNATIAQSPSFVLQFTIPNNSYDINLSPDKRQVIFTNEIEIHEAIREGIVQLWRSQTEGVFKIQNLNFSVPTNCFVGAGTSTSSNGSSRKVDSSCLGRGKLDESHDIDIDTKQVQALFDDRLASVANGELKSDDGNYIDADGDSHSPSRRYGFTDDPTLASSREIEDRKLRKEFDSFSPQKELNGQCNVDDTSIQEAENEDKDTSEQKLSMTPSSLTVMSPSTKQSRQVRPCPPVIENTLDACIDQACLDDIEDADNDCDRSRKSSRTDNRTRPEQDRWMKVSENFNRGGDDTNDSIQRLLNRKVKNVDIETSLEFQGGVKPRYHMETKKSSSASTHLEGCASESSVSNDNTSTTNIRKRFDMFKLEQFGFKTSKKEDDGPAVSDPILVHHQKTERYDSDSDKQPMQLKENIGAESDTNNNTLQSEQSLSQPAAGRSRSQTPRVINPRSVTTEAIATSKIPKSTVWTSFTATDDVVAAAIQARIAMVERKRKCRNHSKILDLQKTARNSSSDSSETCTISEGSGIHAPGNGLTTISLNKDDFKNMKIVGQFNLGFILATTDNGNLWILDQHASDEKYNFEKLCRETVIHEQRLIAPMPLEMSPWEETCVLDHLEIFEKNGFRFSFDPDKPVRHRLSLTALPHSGARDGRKSVQFGKDDVGALCEILSPSTDAEYVSPFGGGTGVDGSGMFSNNAIKRHAVRVVSNDNSDNIIARLPKAIAMFASRACRGSIMIGKALSAGEMDKIVKRLADIEDPWNCPHGRPTMRHVVDLKAIMKNDEKNETEYVAEPTSTICTQYEEYE